MTNVPSSVVQCATAHLDLGYTKNLEVGDIVLVKNTICYYREGKSKEGNHWIYSKNLRNKNGGSKGMIFYYVISKITKVGNITRYHVFTKASKYTSSFYKEFDGYKNGYVEGFENLKKVESPFLEIKPSDYQQYLGQEAKSKLY